MHFGNPLIRGKVYTADLSAYSPLLRDENIPCVFGNPLKGDKVYTADFSAYSPLLRDESIPCNLETYSLLGQVFIANFLLLNLHHSYFINKNSQLRATVKIFPLRLLLAFL